MSEPVLFIGGPWDAMRRVMEHEYPNYHVSYSPLPSVPPTYVNPQLDLFSIQSFRYDKVRALGQTFYIAPPEPWEREEHPVYRIIARLFEGYHVAPAIRSR